MLDAFLCHPEEDDADDGQYGVKRIHGRTTMQVVMVIAEETYPHQKHKDAEGAESHLPLAVLILEDVGTSQSCYQSSEHLQYNHYRINACHHHEDSYESKIYGLFTLPHSF